MKKNYLVTGDWSQSKLKADTWATTDITKSQSFAFVSTWFPQTQDCCSENYILCKIKQNKCIDTQLSRKQLVLISANSLWETCAFL